MSDGITHDQEITSPCDRPPRALLAVLALWAALTAARAVVELLG